MIFIDHEIGIEEDSDGEKKKKNGCKITGENGGGKIPTAKISPENSYDDSRKEF